MQPELYEREFQEWLESLDVTIDGVGADYMHGKGRGLAATRHIKVLLHKILMSYTR